jgi:hypothetical protein
VAGAVTAWPTCATAEDELGGSVAGVGVVGRSWANAGIATAAQTTLAATIAKNQRIALAAENIQEGVTQRARQRASKTQVGGNVKDALCGGFGRWPTGVGARRAGVI